MVLHGYSLTGVYGRIAFKQVQQQTWFSITNIATQTVRCYVMIDGYKRYFTLQPEVTSRWFKARPGYSYSDVSWRCDPTALPAIAGSTISQ